MLKKFINIILIAIMIPLCAGCSSEHWGDNCTSTTPKIQHSSVSNATKGQNAIVDNAIYTAIDYPSHDEATLKAILKEAFANFSDAEANITITNQNDEKTDYVIDYMYFYQGFVTDSGYTLIVRDNVIVLMRDNTKEIDPTVIVPEVTPEIIELAYAYAREDVTSAHPDCVIIEQTADCFYRVESGKFYYRIISVCQIPDGCQYLDGSLYEP